jgi:hypothetical protein
MARRPPLRANAAMDGHTIFVTSSNGRWAVSVSLDGHGASYPDRSRAVAAARRACRQKWEIEGEPCVVRVRDEDGTWRELELFGSAWS